MMVGPNKTYRTRDGRPVRIYAVHEEQPIPVHGAVYEGAPVGWRVHQWESNGVGFREAVDLIEVTLADELRDQIPWEALRPDILWVAADQSGDWYGFHYRPSLNTVFGRLGKMDEWEAGYGDPERDLAPVNMPNFDLTRWRETLIQRPEDK